MYYAGIKATMRLRCIFVAQVILKNIFILVFNPVTGNKYMNMKTLNVCNICCSNTVSANETNFKVQFYNGTQYRIAYKLSIQNEYR